MENIINSKKIYVHGGVFHADDVLSVALLQILGCKAGVIRTNSLPNNIGEDEIVLDIGGQYNGVNRFDHHQSDAPVRENGVKYAAFGQIVKALDICSQPGFESFDEKFACGIDARDNGQKELMGDYPSPVGDTIAQFIPSWEMPPTAMDTAFFDAVYFASGILKREFASRRAAARARSIVLEAAANAVDGIVVLPRFCPWQDVLGTEYRAVVYPALRGGYNAQTVKGHSFPKEWLTEKPEGATFVHQGLFLVATETASDAIKLAELVK